MTHWTFVVFMKNLMSFFIDNKNHHIIMLKQFIKSLTS